MKYQPSKWVLEHLLNCYIPARHRCTPEWVLRILYDLEERFY